MSDKVETKSTITLSEAAKKHGISESTLADAVRAGRIRGYKTKSKGWVLIKFYLNKWLEARKTRAKRVPKAETVQV